MTTLYETDFCQWSQEQADLLRNQEIERIDLENLIEEIESLGRSNKCSLSSYLVRLLIHILKMKYAYDQKGNSRSWDSSILHSRREIRTLIKHSPSLKKYLLEDLAECYEDAKELASMETNLNEEVFPKKCPWTMEDILQEKK